MKETEWFTSEQVANEVKKLRNMERSGNYVGGSLDLPLGEELGCCLNVKGRSFQFFQCKDGGPPMQRDLPITNELQSEICEAYLQFKDENAFFYNEALKYLDRYIDPAGQKVFDDRELVRATIKRWLKEGHTHEEMADKIIEAMDNVYDETLKHYRIKLQQQLLDVLTRDPYENRESSKRISVLGMLARSFRNLFH